MSAEAGRAIDKFLVRFADLVPSDMGYLNSATAEPGQGEDFIIVAGLADHDPRAFGDAHETAARDVGVLGVRRAVSSATVPQCRDGAEVVIAHIGRWRLTLGPNGEAGSFELAEGDVASVPAGVYRRIENLDDRAGFLFIVRGSPAAPVDIHDGSRWIDTSSGTPVLRDDTPAGGPLTGCVMAAAGTTPNLSSPLASDSVQEAGIVSTRASRDGFPRGPIAGWWPHGFSLRRLTLQPGAYIPTHCRHETEVLMLHEGTLEVDTADGALWMGAGDLLTVPVGVYHALRNTTSRRAEAFIVRGSEDPALPQFESLPLRS